MNSNIKIHILSLYLFIVFNSFGQEKSKVEEQEITTWIQQNAIPIKHIEAGNGFSDLQPLKEILKDVKIVGLGESTHGTREFFQVKHRLLEFFVTEMGYTAFALEAPYAACQPINDYVLYGKGDLATVLTGQGYVVWDTEELAVMIEWMRTYNQRMPENEKVSFYGIDFMYNGSASKEKVSAYLQKHNVPMAHVADSLFDLLLIEENLFWSKPKDINMLKEVQLKLQQLITYLTDNRDELVAASSTKEFAQALKISQVMDQWFLLHLPDSMLSTTKNRSEIMGENLFYLMEQEKLNAKFIVWEHNGHVSDGHMETGEPNLGQMLKKKIGDKYYSMAFEFNQGSYQSRVRSAGVFGNLKEVMVLPASKGHLAYYLSQAKKGNFLLNLRGSVDNPSIKQWLNQPQMMRFFGWFNDDKSVKKVDLKRRYDSILFIEHTTPTRPTANALKSAANREGI